LNSGNVCYHSVQNLPVFQFDLASHVEERRLRVFENKMLRWIFGPKRDEVTG